MGTFGRKHPKAADLVLHQVNQHRNNEYNFLASWIHTNTQWAKPEIQQTFQIELKNLQKHCSLIQNKNRKASSWCLLRLSNLKTSHTFLNLSSAILNTHLRELHVRFLRVLPLQICKVKWLEFTEVFFGWDKWQPEICLRSQATEAQ